MINFRRSLKDVHSVNLKLSKFGDYVVTECIYDFINPF